MSSRRIREDHKEYRDIVKGNVDEKLKKHIKGGQRITRRGKEFVVVRVPHVELPSFRYGTPSNGEGVGNGQVDVGDEVGEGPKQSGQGNGNQPGEGGEGEDGSEGAGEGEEGEDASDEGGDEDGDASVEGPAFIAAKKFTGSRPGYSFKTGAQGVGYYRDFVSVSASTARTTRRGDRGKADQ